MEGFERVMLPARPAVDIVRQHGQPHYIKIDIEHFDGPILRALFAAGIRPPYISAEAHDAEGFCALVALGGYTGFKLVDGDIVDKQYSNVAVDVGGRSEKYAFPYDSAGPFGEEVLGPWMNRDDFLRFLAFEGYGWKDVHATTLHDPKGGDRVTLTRYLLSRRFLLRLARLARWKLRG